MYITLTFRLGKSNLPREPTVIAQKTESRSVSNRNLHTKASCGPTRMHAGWAPRNGLQIKL